MFYVGSTLWLENREYLSSIPNYQNFSGCIRYYTGTKFWIDKGKIQSFQDPVTGKWMPASVHYNGKKYWYDKDQLQSFQDPETQEWMPAATEPNGTKFWYDRGIWVDPKTHFWKEREY